MPNPIFTVSDFVAALNQTLEFAYPHCEVQGELSNFKIVKDYLLFFNLKDANSTLECFSTVHAMPGPLEDGMIVKISGGPSVHQKYGFRFNAQNIVPVGEGALRRAADLLAAKLEKEGLFDPSRKRQLPYPPKKIALITAGESAAYADFIKITGARWGGVVIEHYNVLVQGEKAPAEIVAALASANETNADVAVLIRGGGSADDLAAWSDERVVRAVAGSRVPTLVAIGHEVDVCLAELAADKRASTPSNAAELLLPDKKEELRHLRAYRRRLDEQLAVRIMRRRTGLVMLAERLDEELRAVARVARDKLTTAKSLLGAFDPMRPLNQGYACVQTAGGKLVTRAAELQAGNDIEVKFIDGIVASQVKTVHTNKE